MVYIKYVFFSLVCMSSLADETPSFVFTEKEGLKALTKKEAQQKRKRDTKQAPSSKPAFAKDQAVYLTKKDFDLEKNPKENTHSESSLSEENKQVTQSASSSMEENKQATQSASSSMEENKQATQSASSSMEENKQATQSASSLMEENKQAPQSASSSMEENKQATQDSISESFAPEKKSLFKKPSFKSSFFEDTSWVFQKKETKNKIALVPDYSYNKTESSRLGLRFFSFSTEENGYYLALSGARYWPGNYYSSRFSYTSKRDQDFRTELFFIFDNHHEIYYGNLNKFEGMYAPLDEVYKLQSHRLMLDYNLIYQEVDNDFYIGAGARAFFRQERKNLQENQSYFPSEYFLFLRFFGGMDSRDNWKYPKKGAFHQLSMGCKASLVYASSYCQSYGDFRVYFSPSQKEATPYFIQNSVFSLRAFYGASLINPSSYATKYSLGGEGFFQQMDNLRGFKNRRFLGDKIYLAQSELRVPVWKEYVILATFLEIGEVAAFGESFSAFVTNYGGGVRLGWPKDSGMKIRIDYSLGKDLQNQTNSDFIISFLQAF